MVRGRARVGPERRGADDGRVGAGVAEGRDAECLGIKRAGNFGGGNGRGNGCGTAWG